ncbi:Protein of unknown function [Propionibacterium freudenreichii]|nr:Protein of unknown function [Propionibacterium freudenreichii]
MSVRSAIEKRDWNAIVIMRRRQATVRLATLGI